MIVNVLPNRLIRVADELRHLEKRLTYASYSIEEVINGLRHSEDESLQALAEKLSDTLEHLQRKILIIRMIIVALDRIASVYIRTEDGIEDFENEVTLYGFMRYKAQDISRMRDRVSGVFEKL